MTNTNTKTSGTKKLTKKDFFSILWTIVESAEIKENERKTLTAFIDHELELLEKKTGSRKPSKSQIENEKIKAKIIEHLSASETGMTVSELVKAFNAEHSNQKISALVTKMKTDGKVERREEKGKAIFSVPAEVEEEEKEDMTAGEIASETVAEIMERL